MNQTFIDAKKLIEERGHARGTAQVFAPKRDFGFCIVTALTEVSAEINPDPLFAAFKEANGIDQDYPLGDWNDERTKDEVLAAFDKAIEASPCR